MVKDVAQRSAKYCSEAERGLGPLADDHFTSSWTNLRDERVPPTMLARERRDPEIVEGSEPMIPGGRRVEGFALGGIVPGELDFGFFFVFRAQVKFQSGGNQVNRPNATEKMRKTPSAPR